MITNKILKWAYHVYLVKFCSSPDCLQEKIVSLDISLRRTLFRTMPISCFLTLSDYAAEEMIEWCRLMVKKKRSFFFLALHKQIAIKMHGWWSICINVNQSVKTQCLSNWENDSAFSPIKITNWRKNHFSDRPRCFRHGIYSVHFACRYEHRRVSNGIVDRPGMTEHGNHRGA